MDTHSSHPDDMKKLERRLADWKPTPEGLDAEAMLFAAGRASVRPSKAWLAWPVVSVCLALVAVVLGTRMATERSERLALLRELHNRPFEPTPAATPLTDETLAAVPLASNSYLVLRREWEQHPGDWAMRRADPSPTPKTPPGPESPILRARPPGGSFDSL